MMLQIILGQKVLRNTWFQGHSQGKRDSFPFVLAAKNFLNPWPIFCVKIEEEEARSLFSIILLQIILYKPSCDMFLCCMQLLQAKLLNCQLEPPTIHELLSLISIISFRSVFSVSLSTSNCLMNSLYPNVSPKKKMSIELQSFWCTSFQFLR